MDARHETGSQPDGGSLESLRDLLVGEERRRLADLQDRLDKREVTAAEVGEVLPDAVARRTSKDDRLAVALAPAIEGAIDTSVRRNPRVLTDAIFPIMGPAIRKSITQALAGIVEGINRTLEHSMSPKGIRWRIESLRTGKPFAEVVLRHSLVFRVEQVFLIHRDAALLLEHVTAPLVVPAEGDMISGMLGAIQDFVTDSLATRDAGVQQVEFGDQVLEVATGPSAVLACLVRGTVTPATRVRFQEVLEELHGRWSTELQAFDGDPAVFLPLRPTLETLLIEQRAEEERQSKRRVGSTALVGLGLAALFLATVWVVRDVARGKHWSAALAALEQAPGIVVTRAERDGAAYVLEGLRDPLAEDPRVLLQDSGLDPEAGEESWRPFQSLDPVLVLVRAKRTLAPPPTVSLDVVDGRLRLSGRATHAWLERARLLAPSVPGVTAVSDTVGDTDREHARDLARARDGMRVSFESGSAQLTAAAARSLTELLAELEGAVRRAEAVLAIRVAGRETEAEPAGLSAARAAAVVDWLRTHVTVASSIASDESEQPSTAAAQAVLYVSLAAG